MQRHALSGQRWVRMTDAASIRHIATRNSVPDTSSSPFLVHSQTIGRIHPKFATSPCFEAMSYPASDHRLPAAMAMVSQTIGALQEDVSKSAEHMTTAARVSHHETETTWCRLPFRHVPQCTECRRATSMKPRQWHQQCAMAASTGSTWAIGMHHSEARAHQRSVSDWFAALTPFCFDGGNIHSATLALPNMHCVPRQDAPMCCDTSFPPRRLMPGRQLLVTATMYGRIRLHAAFCRSLLHDRNGAAPHRARQRRVSHADKVWR